MVALPRLVIAAPASGCGKTTVAGGLMAALRARGLAVSGHKVGPDYIDPGYHALATGRAPRNLDPFLCGEELGAPLFRHGAAGAQVAVVEGVMGLFDGVDPVLGLAPDFGSTAHVARLLGAGGHPDAVMARDRLAVAYESAGRFGDANYSREELVAEMGAAFLCGVAGIDNATVHQSAAYLHGWLAALKADTRLLVIAAAQAQKAADYILGRAQAVADVPVADAVAA